jgi:hypothetical protein
MSPPEDRDQTYGRGKAYRSTTFVGTALVDVTPGEAHDSRSFQENSNMLIPISFAWPGGTFPKRPMNHCRRQHFAGLVVFANGL